jgi:hypothetical protein
MKCVRFFFVNISILTTTGCRHLTFVYYRCFFKLNVCIFDFVLLWRFSEIILVKDGILALCPLDFGAYYYYY